MENTDNPNIENEATVQNEQTNSQLPSIFDFFAGFWRNKTAHQWIIFLFAFLLYSNTIGNKYAIDDVMVIQENKYTKKGLKGMYGIWFKDSFAGIYGDDNNTVSGGRYRPLTIASFAIENQIFGKVLKNNSGRNLPIYLRIPEAKFKNVMSKLENPKFEITDQRVEMIDGKQQKVLAVIIEVSPGNRIPDAEADVIYEGNPHISHAINALLYALLCVILYLWIYKMFDTKETGSQKAMFIALVASILYAAHPLHTEAVANIKGRDEIVVTLLSILSSYWVLKSINSQRYLLYMSASVLAFVLALFTKESAIPFIIIIPVSIFIFFKDVNFGRIILKTTPFIASVFLFWFAVREPILNWKSKSFLAIELMNDPFLKLSPKNDKEKHYLPFTSNEKNAMVLYTWVEYLKLLVVPYPLTNDYYPKHIGVKEFQTKPTSGNNITEMRNEDGTVRYIVDDLPEFSTPKVILSILLHLIMAIIAIYGLIKKRSYSFALIFYAATFSVVSNLFFPIGTLMAERFLFMPSIAFSLICAIGLAVFVFQKNDQLSLTRVKITVAILTIILAFYTLITFKRNFDWYDNFTLFSKDATVTKNSAKLENSLTSILLEKAGDKDLPISERELLCKKAIIHGTNAVSIHPSYHIAWLLYGNAYFLMGGVKEYEADSLKKNGNITANLKYNEALNLYGEAFRAYKNVRIIRPIYEDVSFNLVEKYRIRGNLFGKINNINESIKDFELANISAKEKNIEVLRLLVSAYGLLAVSNAKNGDIINSDLQHKKSIEALDKGLLLNSSYFITTLSNLEKAYREMAKEDKVNEKIYLSRAEELAQKLKAIK